MKNQATRDLKKCISKRFVENLKWCVIGTIAFVIFIYAFWITLDMFDRPLLAIGILYYLVIIAAMTVLITVNRKLKRGIVNFIKRSLIMSVIFPLIMLVLMINLICIFGFSLMVSFATGCAYILLCQNTGTFEIMIIIMVVSGIISAAFAMALDECLKMTKWLNGIANSISDLIILEDDDSL